MAAYINYITHDLISKEDFGVLRFDMLSILPKFQDFIEKLIFSIISSCHGYTWVYNLPVFAAYPYYSFFDCSAGMSALPMLPLPKITLIWSKKWVYSSFY